jgi:hypothetical protein
VPGEPVRMKRLADVPGLSEKQAKKAAAALVRAVQAMAGDMVEAAPK